MKTVDAVKLLGDGAKGAVVIMNAAELSAFASAIEKDVESKAMTKARQAQRGRPQRIITSRLETCQRAEVIQAIARLWPDASMVKLAEVLGHPRQTLYKYLTYDITERTGTPPVEKIPDGAPAQQPTAESTDDRLGGIFSQILINKK